MTKLTKSQLVAEVGELQKKLAAVTSEGVRICDMCAACMQPETPQDAQEEEPLPEEVEEMREIDAKPLLYMMSYLFHALGNSIIAEAGAVLNIGHGSHTGNMLLHSKAELYGALRHSVNCLELLMNDKTYYVTLTGTPEFQQIYALITDTMRVFRQNREDLAP